MNWQPRWTCVLLVCGLLAATACHRREAETPDAEGAGAPPSSRSETQEGGEERSRALLSEEALSGAPPRPAAAQTKATPDGAKRGNKKQADALFDQPTLLRIQIDIPPSGIRELRSSQWERGVRPVVKATVREGDLVYTNVAIHLKGSAGSFRDIDGKPALTLNFDKFVPEQSFHGLHKISLNNSEQDRTFLCEKVARELFIAAGVPTPRASHATVVLNGRKLGLYVLLEGANKQFLKRYFDNPTGNLYDGGFCRDIDSRLAVNCGEDPKNNSGLRALRAAVRDGSYSRLEKALDIDRFLSMLALEVILCHWDGYSFNRNNWRVFHDLQANRMVFIPHGLDQLFGDGRRFEPTAAGGPASASGEVTQAVLATAQGKQRYRELIAQISTNVFKAEEIAAHIDEIVAGVAPALAETDPNQARAFRQGASRLKQKILRRGEALHGRPSLPLRPVEFGSEGILRLTGWKQSDVQAGDPTLTERGEGEGNRILSVRANGPSTGSWRTRLMLPRGKYQFEGRVRLSGVTVADGDTRSGAGLRISKSMPKKLTGTTDWRPYKFLFEVTEPASDIELICELKATAGEALFDANSLRLVRVQ